MAAPLLAILAAGAGDNNDDIVQALALISPKAVSPLLNALHSAKARVRAGAAVALGHCHNRQAVPPLLTALHDNDAPVRYGAATSLGTLGDVRAVPLLMALLHSRDLALRLRVIAALRVLRDRRATPALIAALLSADPTVQRNAAEALGALEDPAATPALLAALRNRRSFDHLEAVHALGWINDPRAIPALITVLRAPDVDVCWSAAAALGKYRKAWRCPGCWPCSRCAGHPARACRRCRCAGHVARPAGGGAAGACTGGEEYARAATGGHRAGAHRRCAGVTGVDHRDGRYQCQRAPARTRALFKIHDPHTVPALKHLLAVTTTPEFTEESSIWVLGADPQ